jgi:hypothetical protein
MLVEIFPTVYVDPKTVGFTTIDNDGDILLVRDINEKVAKTISPEMYERHGYTAEEALKLVVQKINAALAQGDSK